MRFTKIGDLPRLRALLARLEPLRPLLRPVRIVLLNVLIFLVLCEAAIYIFPQWIPTEIVARFPSPQRRYFAEEKKLASSPMFRGDQYLYSLNATYAQDMKPFHIDGDGFRNPEALKPGQAVDVVFLGDSLMMVARFDRDLAWFARDEGMTAYNLGMDGYGPLHYELAYDKYILDRDIGHKWLVMTFCLANDVKDLEESLDIYFKRGKTYLEYLNKSLLSEKSHYRVLTFIVLREALRMSERRMESRPVEEPVAFDTPYGRAEMTRNRLKHMGIELGEYLDKSLGDELAKRLNGIVAKANAQGAKCLFVMMPNWDGIYSGWVPGYEREKATVEADYARFENFFRSRLRGDVAFVNAREAIRRAAETELVTGDLTDYHLNSKGVEVLWNLLRPLLAGGS